MDAIEAREMIVEKGVPNQYDEAQSRIKAATEKGIEYCYALKYGAVLQEVADKLVEDKFYVTTTVRENLDNSKTMVSWDYMKNPEKAEGKFTLVDLTKDKPSDIFRFSPPFLVNELDMLIQIEKFFGNIGRNPGESKSE